MEKRENKNNTHVLALPYPSQGHINPMLQFSRRLASKGIKATLAITKFIFNTLNPTFSDDHVSLATFSDGYDDGGFFEAESIDAYVARLEVAGSKTLGDIIEEYFVTSNPVTCVIYDSFLPWGLEVAKKYHLVGAAFFTQACSVDYIYYLVYHGKLTVPIASLPVELPGLPPLDASDLPSFVGVPGPYPAYAKLVVNQNRNVNEADFVLINTYYELENEVVDAMSKQCPLLTIGPTVPSFYLDNRVEYDKEYNLNLFYLDNATSTTYWLSTKPSSSVVYVSFGSMACLPKAQIEELAWGLKASGCYFLWVLRESEEGKLPEGFAKEIGEKGLLVRWIPQLQVLANNAIGCFFTHCGWNSTLEALALGVPMIGMPQWTDQPIDAKFIQDVWKVGVRVKVDDKELVSREEIVACIMEMMVGEKRKELTNNAKKWKDLAKQAVSQGGSSDKNIDEFISKIKVN